MNVRNFALIYGVAFAAVGVAGFIPAFVTPHAHELAVDQGSGDLFGLFRVNIVHNIVHLAFGAWGLAVYRNTGAAIGYARSVAIIYALLVIIGFIPGLSTLFGLVPLHGNDIWLHALLAAGAAYFGFIQHGDPGPASGRAVRGA